MFADYSYVFRILVAATGFLPDRKTLIIAKVMPINKDLETITHNVMCR